ncbi:hypothetical protein DL93DRAFT_2081373 [Clavulina sp. PMI_390]|nr:hypothetical protein DL93DRAFT_2081373 [Clavulina sp. PMI_390]
MDITMRGTTTLTIGRHCGEEEVRYSSSVSWTIVISDQTTPTGLKIFVSKEFARSIADETVTSQFASGEKDQLLRPKRMLEVAFPDEVSLTEEMKALEQFEGIWSCIYPGIGAYKLGNPFFTEQGDLLAELFSAPPSAAPLDRHSNGEGEADYSIDPPSVGSPSAALPALPIPAPMPNEGVVLDTSTNEDVSCSAEDATDIDSPRLSTELSISGSEEKPVEAAITICPQCRQPHLVPLVPFSSL